MTSLIKQRGNGDCAIAVVAMYLNLDYENVVELFTNMLDDNWSLGSPVSDITILQALHRAGQPSVHVVEFNSASPAIVTINSINLENSGHVLYWDGSAVFDPSLMRTIDDYETMLQHATSFIQRIVHFTPMMLLAIQSRSARANLSGATTSSAPGGQPLRGV